MFNSKKLLTLCATTVASLSTFGALSQVAFADTPKAGDTVVVYEGTSAPAEWGLSVPASVKLDKVVNMHMSASNMDHNIHYGNMKIGIVDAQGSSLVDTAKDRTFIVSGKGTGTNGNLSFTDKAGQKHNEFLYGTVVGDQGSSEPGVITEEVWNAADNTSLTIGFETKANGSNAKAEKWLQFGVNEDKANFDKDGTYNETISWTAVENNN